MWTRYVVNNGKHSRQTFCFSVSAVARPLFSSTVHSCFPPSGFLPLLVSCFCTSTNPQNQHTDTHPFVCVWVSVCGWVSTPSPPPPTDSQHFPAVTLMSQ